MSPLIEDSEIVANTLRSELVPIQQMSGESLENSDKTSRSNEQAKQASLTSIPISNSIFPTRDDASDPDLIILLEAEGDPLLVKQENEQPDSLVPPAAEITFSPTTQNEIALEANQNILNDLNDPIGNHEANDDVGHSPNVDGQGRGSPIDDKLGSPIEDKLNENNGHNTPVGSNQEPNWGSLNDENRVGWGSSGPKDKVSGWGSPNDKIELAMRAQAALKLSLHYAFTNPQFNNLNSVVTFYWNYFSNSIIMNTIYLNRMRYSRV